jgi:hypothetical protein
LESVYEAILARLLQDRGLAVGRSAHARIGRIQNPISIWRVCLYALPAIFAVKWFGALSVGELRVLCVPKIRVGRSGADLGLSSDCLL